MGILLRLLFSILVFLSLLTGYWYIAQADVTGSFETHISMEPQTNATEIELAMFDIENNLNVTLVVSGLSTTFHTHFGIAGIEDATIRAKASFSPENIFPIFPTPIGFDIEALLVFARFQFNSTVPFYTAPPLHFLKKVVTSTLRLMGIRFTNVAQFEDTAAFVSQTPAYAFGDVISIFGSTPQGVSITATTGICMQEIVNSIKKHAILSLYSVNPDCATTPKPDILFDFEKIQITNVPLAPSLLASALVSCVKIKACTLVLTLRIAGGPVPLQTSLVFTDLLSLTFSGATITLTAGIGTMQILVTSTGSIGTTSVTISAPLLGSESTSANLTASISISPGVGITSAVVTLSIATQMLAFSATATYAGPPAVLTNVEYRLSVTGSLLDLATTAKFTPTGLTKADLNLTIKF